MLRNFLFRCLLFFIVCEVYAFDFKGKVVSALDKGPIEFGTIVVVELSTKVHFEDGLFVLKIPKVANYTLFVTSPGFKSLEKKIFIKEGDSFTLELEPHRVVASSLQIYEHSDKQSLSKNSIKQEDIKKIPATFGDSLNAVSILPGITKSNPLLGTLNIRGIPTYYNKYYVDGIPILYPQHFGLLQSILANDFIGNIDIYSSASPAQYTGIGGIIDISTKDVVKNLVGKAIINVISADIYLESPFNKKIKKNETNSDSNKESVESKNKGYWIASARVGYSSFTLLPLLTYLYRLEAASLPQYYDWQAKSKFFLDDKGEHTVSIVYFGFYDSLSFSRNKSLNLKQVLNPVNDPLADTLIVNDTRISNNIGLQYTFQNSSKLINEVNIFYAMNYSYLLHYLPNLVSLGLQDKKRNLSIFSNIIGVKDKVSWKWSKYTTLTIGMEATAYLIRAKGQSSVATLPLINSSQYDLGLDFLFNTQDSTFNKNHLLLSGYAEDSFYFLGVTFTPGIRVNYLQTIQQATVEPRLLLSYRTPWNMIFSSAVGWYSSFSQINFLQVNQGFNHQPVITTLNSKPEKSRQISAGIEQNFSFIMAKVEGFYNTYTNLLQRDANYIYGNNADSYSYGIEALLRFVTKVKDVGLFSIVSYSYVDAKIRYNTVFSSLLKVNYDPQKYYDQPATSKHAIKLVLGVSFGKNTIAGKYQIASGQAYTPVIGSYATPNSSIERYSSIYGDPYSKNFGINHSLDIRYSRTFTFKWGSMDLYVEAINVYYARPIAESEWNYSQQYSSNNPLLKALSLSVIIPNFGIEIRF